MLVCI